MLLGERIDVGECSLTTLHATLVMCLLDERPSRNAAGAPESFYLSTSMASYVKLKKGHIELAICDGLVTESDKGYVRLLQVLSRQSRFGMMLGM